MISSRKLHELSLFDALIDSTIMIAQGKLTTEGVI